MKRQQLRAVVGQRLTYLTQTKKLAEHARADVGGSTFANALARVLAQGVGDFVAHDHRNFVIGELELLQDAGVKSDLAAGHAESVDLVGADQVDLPLPAFCTVIPLERKRNDLGRDGTQAYQLRVVFGCQCVLGVGLLHHLSVLRAGGAFDVLRRHQSGKRRSAPHLDTLARLRSQHSQR